MIIAMFRGNNVFRCRRLFAVVANHWHFTQSCETVPRVSKDPAWCRCYNSSSFDAESKLRKVGNTSRNLTKSEIKEKLSYMRFHSSKENEKGQPWRALKLLEELLQHQRATGNGVLKQGMVFNVLRACQTQKETQLYVNRLTSTLSLLKKERSLWDGRRWPSLVLGAICKTTKDENAPLVALDLLKTMQHYGLKNVPNIIDYSAVLSILAQRGMGRQAIEILQTMERLHRSRQLQDAPNTITFTAVLRALANQNEKDAFRDAVQLVARMERLFQAGNHHVRPNIVTYTTLLQCHANMGNAKEAEKLLHRMHNLHDTGVLDKGPNVVSYSTVMEAWAKSGLEEAPDACLHLLDAMNGSRQPEMQPTIITYGIVFKCLAEHGRAKESIDLMTQLWESNDVYPNAGLYNWLISAIARSPEDDRAIPQRVEAVLNLMQEMHQAGHEHLQPSPASFCKLLQCFSQRGMARDAERLLRQVQDRHESGFVSEGPDTIMYNIVLNAYSKTTEKKTKKRGSPSEQALKLLKEMETGTSSNASVSPDVISYTSVMNCLAKEGKAVDAREVLHRMQENGVKPNMVTYSCLLQALAVCGETGSAREALELTHEMWDLYNNKELDRPPDFFSYVMVLKCLASEGLAKEAITLLERLHTLFEEGHIDREPDTIMYNSVLDILAECDLDEAVSLALDLVERMKERRSEGNKELRPDVVTYTSVLKCLASRGMGQEAMEQLQHMRTLNQKGELPGGPNLISYNCVMNALAKSKHDTSTHAHSVLEEMRQNPNVEPDDITRSNFIFCYTKIDDTRLGEEAYERIVIS